MKVRKQVKRGSPLLLFFKSLTLKSSLLIDTILLVTAIPCIDFLCPYLLLWLPGDGAVMYICPEEFLSNYYFVKISKFRILRSIFFTVGRFH